MRVLLISHGFQPDYEAGFANGLSRNGVEAVLISSDRTLTDRLDSSVRQINLRGNQDPLRPAWKKALNMIRYFGALLLLLARMPKVPVHMIGLFAVKQPLMWRWECYVYRLFGRRMIMTVHNVMPHDCNLAAVREKLIRAYHIPDYLVVHTRRVAEQLVKEFGVIPERIIVMEHGIDEIPLLSQDQVTHERAALGVFTKERLVVFFGTVLPYKGVDLLLDAARQPGWDARILIAGRCGDANYGNRLRAQIEVHPLKDRIVWNNRFLSEQEVGTILSAADVVVMPYRHVDQSGVLFAALRYGVPVVAFDVGSLRDHLSCEVGRIVPPGDVTAFAKAAMEIVPARQVRPAIQEVARHFLWEITVKPVLPLYF